MRRRVGCCLPVLSVSSTASFAGSLTVSVFLLAVSALTHTTRLPAPMNTMVSLWRPLMKFLPWIVSRSPIFSLSGLTDVTTGAPALLAVLAMAGIAASRKTGMARRARRERRLIAFRIGGGPPPAWDPPGGYPQCGRTPGGGFGRPEG